MSAGIPFVVAAPSGTGKTTVCRRVVAEGERIEFSISHTTRTRREGERDGVDYHFVSDERFRELADRGAFLEWAIYNGHRYGTSWSSIEEPLAEGRDVLLEIEVQGARQVRARRADARMIFLLPPSMEVLRSRLESRGTDAPDEIERSDSAWRAESSMRRRTSTTRWSTTTSMPAWPGCSRSSEPNAAGRRTSCADATPPPGPASGSAAPTAAFDRPGSDR